MAWNKFQEERNTVKSQNSLINWSLLMIYEPNEFNIILFHLLLLYFYSEVIFVFLQSRDHKFDIITTWVVFVQFHVDCSYGFFFSMKRMMRRQHFHSYKLNGFLKKLRHCDRVAVMYSVCYYISCKPMWTIKEQFYYMWKYVFSTTNLKKNPCSLKHIYINIYLI
jgi:hypothetical protein